jgi:hypothetical protein
MSQTPFYIIPDDGPTVVTAIVLSGSVAVDYCTTKAVALLAEGQCWLEFAKSSPERKIIAVALLLAIGFCVSLLIKRLRAVY